MMNRKNRRSLVRVLLITLATMSLLVWSLSSSAVYSPNNTKASKANNASASNSANPKVSAGSALLSPFAMMAGGTKPAGNLDQVRNGSAASPLNPVDWVNGNAGASNAHYKEGQSIPYRLVLTNLPLGVNSVKIEWDITHSSKNAIDYITSVVRQPPGGISEPIHVCGDGIYNTVIAGCNDTAGTGYSTFPILAPPVSKLVGALPQPTTSFANLPENDKVFRVYNGTNGSMAYINNADGNLGDLNVAQSSTRASITFTATSSTVILAWSGHIGSRVDWGSTGGVPNSAGGISGSPYHTRFIELCPLGGACGGGNQDRSLSAAAVTPPLECNLSGPATACQGSTNTHTVDAASLDTTATYTFALSANTAGATIGNSNGNPLSPPVYAEVTTTGPGSYTITATASNAGGSAPGCPFTTTVTATTSATDPSAQTKCEGQPVTFSTTASGTSPFTYQWQKDGVDISGATSSSYTISTVATSDAGTYRVIVTGTCGSDTTAGALLTVNATTTTSKPADATKCEGEAVTFSTTAAGTGPFTYQWQKSGVDIVGATSSSYTINSVATSDAATYTVKTTGACNFDSKSATLAVNQTVGATDPNATTSCIGGTATFSTTASGTGPFTYQWKKGGVDIAGATSSSYTINPVALADAGTYSVFVTGACGDKTTAGAILTVNNPSVAISLHSGCDSGVFLQADATVSGTPTYQWKLNGGNIVGATNSTLVPTVPGTYSVTVLDGNSCPASASRILCFAFQGETAMVGSAPDSTLAAKAKPEPTGIYFGLVRLLLGLVTLI